MYAACYRPSGPLLFNELDLTKVIQYGSGSHLKNGTIPERAYHVYGHVYRGGIMEIKHFLQYRVTGYKKLSYHRKKRHASPIIG